MLARLFVYLQLLCVIYFAAGIDFVANAGVFYPSQDGSFSYETSLTLTPIEQQLFQPKYSSLNGNGLLGVGWTMESLSTISRCSSAQAHLSKDISLSDLDAFCLDGHILEFLALDTYIVRLPTGSQKKIFRVGNCDANCYFYVLDGKGESRWYGYNDINPLNGNPVTYKDSTPVVWSLSHIQLNNSAKEVVSIDHVSDFITGSSLPKKARITYFDANEKQWLVQKARFKYQSRSDDFAGAINGEALRMSHLLTEIDFIPRQKRKNPKINSDRSNTIRFSYELSADTYEKFITQIEHCKWNSREFDGAKSQKCQRESLYWTGAEFNTNHLDCERHWNLPFEHYFNCNNQRFNPIVLRLIINDTNEPKLIKYAASEPSPSMESAQFPFLTVKGVKELTGNLLYKPALLELMTTLTNGSKPTEIYERFWERSGEAIEFDWANLSELSFGRTNGFDQRISYFYFDGEFSNDKMVTFWEKQGAFGKMVRESIVESEARVSRFTCDYASYSGFQPYISKRKETILQPSSAACELEEKIEIDSTSLQPSIVERTSTEDPENSCDFISFTDRQNINTFYRDFLELESCDYIFSYLSLKLDSPEANNKTIIFPPDLKEPKLEFILN